MLACSIIYLSVLLQPAYQCPSMNAIIDASVRHLESLARAAQNQPSLISIQRPLLGFLLPKTGSNTQLHFLKAAMAVGNQQITPGCKVELGLGRTRCMADVANLTACTVAFANHFVPDELVKTLAEVNQVRHGCTGSDSDSPAMTAVTPHPQ